MYFWLFDRGIPLIALYYRLIDPLLNEDYKDMQIVSDSILNLPVHQDINYKDLYFMVNLIKDGLIELNK